MSKFTKVLLKTPINLGYPKIPIDIVNELSFQVAPTAKEYYRRSLLSQNNKDVPTWDDLPSTDKLSYYKLASDNSYWVSNAKPKLAAGFSLFSAQNAMKRDRRAIRADVTLAWNMLSTEEKALYSNPELVKFFHDQRYRIWTGYEIINYIQEKRILPEFPNTPDLYYDAPRYLGLYPWEIISDKCSYDFNRDINLSLYGKEAFSQLTEDFYDDIVKIARLVKLSKKEFHQICSADDDSSFTYQKYKKFIKYRELKLAPYVTAMFAYKANPDNIWPSRFESRMSRPFSDMRLALEIELIMTLLFEYIGVVGAEGYNWKKDMQEKSRGLPYFYRGYALPSSAIDKEAVREYRLQIENEI